MEDLKSVSSESEEHWISISDLMSVLMILFLLIAISYMIFQQRQVREIAITYSTLKNDLYDDLYKEFEPNLEEWKAEIDKQTISVRFLSPDVLFEVGSSNIRLRYMEILTDFFPRYLAIITKDKYKNDIEEVRIEGHTSSEWRENVTGDLAYFNNMELSQDRTRSVLTYSYNLPEVLQHRVWLRDVLTANGLSSSKLIFTGGNEDKNLSRRVEFRVRTKAEQRIAEILEGLSK